MRFASSFPDLAETFAAASERRRRQAAVAVCVAAVAQADLRGDDVDAAVAALLDDSTRFSELGEKIHLRAEQLDDAYLELHQAGGSDQANVLMAFRRARAAAALDVLLSGRSEHLRESLYEAIFASDHEAKAMHLAMDVLRSPE